ncbi:MAG: hypothetical protein K9G46_03620 [Flavobacteriales bacterium]|nr:hypothetical protein [Flavobacteriales bacterium]
MNEEGYERFEDDWNECSNAVGYAQYPRADFIVLPPAQGSMTFRQRQNLLWVKEVGASGLYGAEIDTTIQGHQYLNCWSNTRTDSLGEVSSVIIDQHYGLIMFSYRDQYRWERVLD